MTVNKVIKYFNRLTAQIYIHTHKQRKQVDKIKKKKNKQLENEKRVLELEGKIAMEEMCF